MYLKINLLNNLLFNRGFIYGLSLFNSNAIFNYINKLFYNVYTIYNKYLDC